jgi:hypothetical protein
MEHSARRIETTWFVWRADEVSKIYIILMPYSADPEKSFKRSAEFAQMLRDANLVCFSPILHTHPFEQICPNSYEFYMKWDFALYQAFSSPAFCFPDDWKDSSGCRAEYRWAQQHGYPCISLSKLIWSNREVDI